MFLLSISYPVIKGYVYSSFLKPYNPAKVQKVDAENRFCDDDFDNISLFVSSRPASDSVTGTPEGSISDSSSSLSGTCGKSETNSTDVDSFQEVDEQVRIWTWCKDAWLLESWKMFYLTVRLDGSVSFSVALLSSTTSLCTFLQGI